MPRDNLLKEAIAEAEQVRNAAIANARAALEEAFAPTLSSMLTNKLRTEMEDATSGDGHGAEEGGETDRSVVTAEQKALRSSGINAVDNKQPAAAARTSSDIENPDQEVDKMGEGTVPHDGHDPEGEDVTKRRSTHDAKGNLHKEHGNHFAVANRAHSDAMYEDDEDDDLDFSFGDDEDEMDMDGGMDMDMDFGAEPEGDLDLDFAFGDEEEDEGDLDLEAIIRELEAAVLGGDQNEEFMEGEDIEEDISAAAKRIPATQTVDGMGDAPKAAPAKEKRFVKMSEAEDGYDDEVDLDEILREMDAEDIDEDASQLQAENVELKRSLKEHRDAVRFLKSRLEEVSVLNGKLLYTNKLFKAYNLNAGQKMKVVETFDRTKTLREVKLVYSTLTETFRTTTGKRTASKLVKEGLASRAVGSTKPKTPVTPVINDGDKQVARFQKLAGIKTQR